MKRFLCLFLFTVLLTAALCFCAVETPRGFDFNGNGFTDRQDLVAGARRDAVNHPNYDPSYFEEGWPPEDTGVCADVIWRAFREAGYDLRAMISADIAAHQGDYPTIVEPNDAIDFRRVRNLKVFFDKYAESLTCDLNDRGAWQPGDIAVFRTDKHIGIISDRTAEDGTPLLLHNGGQEDREENYLVSHEVTSHYRFDARSLPAEYLIAWEQ